MRYFNWLYSLFLVLILNSYHVCAQREAQHWIFGDNCRVGFTYSSAAPDTCFPFNTLEGCATMAHGVTGDLLFYTNGETVYDSTGAVMSNGSGLLGHYSSTQSATIIRDPGNTRRYYVFTIDDGFINRGASGARYSIVDMSVGNGQVVSGAKNVLLFSRTAEKIVAIRHQNNVDWWVLIQGNLNNQYRAYPVTANGVGTPVLSNAGPSNVSRFDSTRFCLGAMKASLDGTRLVLAHTNNDQVVFLHFDPATGRVGSPKVSYDVVQPYGVEFSPDGSKFYVSTFRKIYQYDTPTIQSLRPRYLLADIPGLLFNSLQLGMDHRIYCSIMNSNRMAVIRKPDERGTACDFSPLGFPFAPYFSAALAGLPNVPAYYLRSPLQVKDGCVGVPITVTLLDTNSYDSVHYFFRDPLSGATTISRRKLTSFTYNRPGKYEISAHLFFQKRGVPMIDSVKKSITIRRAPSLNLGADTAYCHTYSHLLIANFSDAQYLWSDSSKLRLHRVKKAGWTWVEANNQCGTVRDSIHIRIDEPIAPSLQDTFICDQGTVYLDPLSSGASCYWSTGSRDTSIAVSNFGTYTVVMNNLCGTYFDTARIQQIPWPPIILPEDTVLCTGDTLRIEVDPQGNELLWSNGDTGHSYITDTNDYITLIASSFCGRDTQSLRVQFTDPLNLELGPDTFLCDEERLLLSPVQLDSGVTYHWNINHSGDRIWVDSAGTYRVEASNVCGRFESEINIDHFLRPHFSLGPNQKICANEEVLVQLPPFASEVTYQWEDGSEQLERELDQPGVYSFTALNVCGIQTDSIEIYVHQDPYLGIRDTFMCLNETVTFNYDFLQKDLVLIWNETDTSWQFTAYDWDDYVLWIKDSTGCIGVESFEITECKNPFYAPNSFSPNYDGLNEYFRIYLDHAEEFELVVLNRWNQEVFRTENPETGWDGTNFNNGSNCPVGEYIWKVVYREYADNHEVIKMGRVFLIR